MSEHEHTDNPVCPYCGHENRDAWEWNLGPGLEGDGEVDCDSCGKPMIVLRHRSITYSTKAKKEAVK